MMDAALSISKADSSYVHRALKKKRTMLIEYGRILSGQTVESLTKILRIANSSSTLRLSVEV